MAPAPAIRGLRADRIDAARSLPAMSWTRSSSAAHRSATDRCTESSTITWSLVSARRPAWIVSCSALSNWRTCTGAVRSPPPTMRCADERLGGRESAGPARKDYAQLVSTIEHGAGQRQRLRLPSAGSPTSPTEPAWYEPKKASLDSRTTSSARPARRWRTATPWSTPSSTTWCAPHRPGPVSGSTSPGIVAGVREYQRDVACRCWPARCPRSSIGVPEPLAWSFVTVIDAAYWGPFFDYLGFRPVLEVDDSDNLHYVVYGNDWRRFPVDAWLDLMNEREHSGGTGPPPDSALRPPPISGRHSAKPYARRSSASTVLTGSPGARSSGRHSAPTPPSCAPASRRPSSRLAGEPKG